MKIYITTLMLLLLSSTSFAQEQSTATLSEARYEMSTVTLGSKTLFIGGGYYDDEDGFSAVDIYDTETDQWSTFNLSVPAAISGTSVGSAGNFAITVTRERVGEDYIGVVYKYNAETNEWNNPELSDDRHSPNIVALNNKIVIAGGESITDAVDIYDIETESWTTATLSEARYQMSNVTIGSQILFIGGGYYNDEDGFSAVDIYDTETDQWSSHNLSVPAAKSDTFVGSSGNFAIFVTTERMGEDYKGIAYLYNAETGEWSNPELSSDRYYPNIVGLNNKLIIAGGLQSGSSDAHSDEVDIFDTDSQTWSTTTLSEARAEMVTTTIGSKILFIGGSGGFDSWGDITNSSSVDIYDTETDEWTSFNLSVPARYNTPVGSAGNTALMVISEESGEDYVGVSYMYDAESNTWSNPELSNNRWLPNIVGLNDKIVIAGGFEPESYTPSDAVDIFTVELPTSIEQADALPQQVLLNQNYPNPFNPATIITFELSSNQQVQLKVFDITGRKVAKLMDNSLPAGSHQISFDSQNLSSGVYFYQLTTGGESLTRSMTLIK